MNSRLHKITLSTILLFASTLLLSSSAYSQGDSDSLLLTIPPIVASVTKDNQTINDSDGLGKVKQLNGRWRFSYDGFNDYFRFNQSTAAATSDKTIFVIQGGSSISSDFSGNWCDGGLVGAYSTETKSYLILCNWGYPTNDLGSLFDFKTINSSFPFRHFYFIPSTGELSTGFFDNGTANRLSTTFSLPIGQALDKQTIQNNEEAIASAKAERYNNFINNKTLSKQSLNAESQVIQAYFKKLLELQKTK